MKLLLLFFIIFTNIHSSIEPTSFLPNNIIDLKPLYPFSQKSYALLMDKSQYSLTLYENVNGKITKVKSYHAIFGKNVGDKFYQGDKRTPEGIYFILEIIHETQLLPEYGKRALVLNYPNPIDQLNGKTGLGIWLHSVDDPKRLEILNDTRGCLAISNDDIIELSSLVEIRETPVIIVQKSNLISEKELKKNQKYFHDLVQEWKNAWENNDIENYIQFYSDSFYSRNMNKVQWKKYKRSLASTYKKISIDVNNLNVFNFDSYIAILFQQKYESPGLKDTGKKLLYLEKINDNYKIVSESWHAFSQKLPTTISKKDEN